MCGIVGYIGEKESSQVLLEGLKKLEYRGYDSAGIAVFNGSNVNLIKREGHLEELEKAVSEKNPRGNLGIGHTRWATHGRPCERNAHPHLDCTGKIALVHNGIIENYLELRESLELRGHTFRSETDTEVIIHLIEENYDGDLVKAVRGAVKELEGSFAIAVICSDNPDLIVAARVDSPLVLGLGEEEYFVASDIPAILNRTRKILLMENNEIARVTRNGVEITTFDDKLVSRDIFEVKWSAEAAEKGGYEDFMLKEIFEQSLAIRETLRGRITPDSGIIPDEISLTEEEVKNLDKVFIVACGTSFHAGLVAKYAIEKWARLPVETEISSEFRYRDPVINSKTLVIAITQSGETADTLAGLRQAKKDGAKVITISNVVGSSATREADGVFYTHAGPEIGVAATKTLTAQMVALYILALYLAQVRDKLSKKEIEEKLEELQKLPDFVSKVLAETTSIKESAERFVNYTNFMFLGRSVGYPVALEGALKLKEISYIHAEGYPAGEMKHGPIALINNGLPVVAVATKGHVHEKIISNIEEVKARGATVIAVANEGDKEIAKHADYVFYVPGTSEIFSAVLAVIPLQLFAYYVAKLRGCDVDQPRNLAKSVTVE